ncbi:putative effector protein [Ceratobasidium theobromae]|uniref:Putative effector protein n=1 Tax=Ceratobasidium theobromae TaxID=1582974 RepID=A0A5N5QFK1_9AGAM|nr:putative effector protein [Ceratobasidium theobromae]
MIFLNRLFAVAVLGGVSTALAMPALNGRDPTDLVCGGDRFSTTNLPAANEALLAKGSSSSFASRVVNVYWNVIHADKSFKNGYLTSEQAGAAINALNEHFAIADLSFKLAKLQYKENADWFKHVNVGMGNVLDNPQAAAMKDELHTGTAQDLNLYSVGFGDSSLGGYATFPWWYTDSPKRDGVVFKWNTIPGNNSLPNYNQGKILAHEVGHWAGLFHTFQGGCDEKGGDYVDDTPAEASAASGCPATRDTCPGGGQDPIHNHMDYTYDACKTDPFTRGQLYRIQAGMNLYRVE